MVLDKKRILCRTKEHLKNQLKNFFVSFYLFYSLPLIIIFFYIQSSYASDPPQLKKLLLNKSHLTFKSCCVTTEGGAGAAVRWRLALGREFTPANSKTAEDRGAERDTSDPSSRRGIKTLQVLFDRVL